MRFLSVASLVLIAGSAAAADLPSRKEPPLAPPPAFTWTGFYLGLNGGYLIKGNNAMTAATANLVDTTAANWAAASALGASGVAGGRLDGAMSGAQIGYNFQFADKFVAGLEADIQGGGAQGGGNFGSVTSAPTLLVPRAAVTNVDVSRKLNYLGTLRGRLGYAVTPTLLAYATGGLAYGRATISTTIKQSLSPSLLVSSDGESDFAGTRVGWTVGGGVEWAFYPNLSAKLEYLYYDLGVPKTSNTSLLTHSNLTGAAQVVDATIASTRFNGHLIRAGLNYHLDLNPPTAPGSAPFPWGFDLGRVERSAFGDWRFRFTPYAWAIGINGNMTAKGITTDVNSSFYEVLTTSNHLAAWMSYIEARNGPLSLYADIAWSKISFVGSHLRQSNPIGAGVLTIGANGSLKSEMLIGEAWAGYELARWRQNGGASATAIDAYAGLRYSNFTNTLSLNATHVLDLQALGLSEEGGKVLSKSGTIAWVDPIVGLRLRHQIGEGDEFTLRGDIGGFGVGSKFSWQTVGAYTHDFKVGDITLASMVGYRALSIDYAGGSGTAKRGVDEIIHGPIVGVSVPF